MPSLEPEPLFLLDPAEVVRHPDGEGRQKAIAAAQGLLNELAELREKDAAAVRDALPLLLTRAAAVPMHDGLPEEERRARQARCSLLPSPLASDPARTLTSPPPPSP